MRSTWNIDLSDVLLREGGFVNDPRDAGGATNHGVTQKEYDHWRAEHGLPLRSVRLIADEEVSAIYLQDYWMPIRGDRLPAGVDYCVFDFAVNSGPVRANKFLQRAISAIPVDGVIGDRTLAQLQFFTPAEVIDNICDARQKYLEGLLNFDHFGEGWTNRVKAVRQKAKTLA